MKTVITLDRLSEFKTLLDSEISSENVNDIKSASYDDSTHVLNFYRKINPSSSDTPAFSFTLTPTLTLEEEENTGAYKLTSSTGSSEDNTNNVSNFFFE